MLIVLTNTTLINFGKGPNQSTIGLGNKVELSGRSGKTKPKFLLSKILSLICGKQGINEENDWFTFLPLFENW